MTVTSGNLAINKVRERAKLSASPDVSVNWTWNDEAQGLVSWNFQNNSSEQKSVVLFRSGYYFGNAFWPVYVQNGMTSWMTSVTPLVDSGVQNNTMPIAVIDFGNGNKIIAFVFTLAPNQKWSVLEGGFSSAMPPTDAMVYDLTLEQEDEFCIGYDEQQVIDWDLQTQTTMQGYTPNPSQIHTLEFTVPDGTNFVALFNDPISAPPCPPSPNCLQDIENGIKNGNFEEFLKGVMCVIQSGIFDAKDSLKKLFHALIDRL